MPAQVLGRWPRTVPPQKQVSQLTSRIYELVVSVEDCQLERVK